MCADENFLQRGEIWSDQRSVGRDICKNDRDDTQLLDHANEIKNVDRGDLGPSSYSYVTVFCIDAHSDLMTSETIDQVLEKNRAIDRTGSDHYSRHARFNKSGGSFQRANAAPDLHGDVQRADEPLDH